MIKFLNIAFLLILFLTWSCSNLDDPSGLGRKIVERKSQDNMRSGVYNTIKLTQEANTYGSVDDSLWGLHIYTDFLHYSGGRVSQWAIGNWKNEETILRLSYFADTSSRLHRILYDLADDTTINRKSIKADLVWTNLPRYNSFDEVGVEVGMFISYDKKGGIDGYSKDSLKVKNDKGFFPLNFISVNPKSLNNSVPLTIESFLMKGKWPQTVGSKDTVIDSTIVHRYDVDWTNFVDTIRIDSTFFIPVKNRPDTLKATVNRDTMSTQKKHKLWQSDTVVLWKHFIDSSFYDSYKWIIGDSINGTLALYSQKTEVGRITRKNKTAPNNAHGYGGSIYDTLIFNIPKTILYRDGRSVEIKPHGTGGDIDSIIYTTRFENAREPIKVIAKDTIIGNVIPDTLWQSGTSYILPLDKVPATRGLRAIGGKDNLGDFMYTRPGEEENKMFKDTLSIYLRVDKNSTHNNNVLHVSSPLIRISYKKNSDPVKTIEKDVNFSERSIIAFSSDILKDNMPVISGGLQRFAEIDLNLHEFFGTIRQEGFLSIGLADLTLFLDTLKTDFPLQYGDSILVNAIITEKKMTPGEIFKLPRVLRTSSAYIIRDFSTKRVNSTVKVPIEGTLVDYLYKNEIYEKDAPEKAYLYLWLDDWTMGRIFFNPRSPVYLTYILQTRKDGGL